MLKTGTVIKKTACGPFFVPRNKPERRNPKKQISYI